MQFPAAVACVAVLLLSETAHSSGSYGNSLLSPSFRFTYVENVRKSFESSEQGEVVSGSLIRIDQPLGAANAILMISPVGEYQWLKVHPVMSAWLEEGLTDKHRTLVEQEAERLSGVER